MTAIDTILFDFHNTVASQQPLTATTTATGDSATVRYFPTTSKARLETVCAQNSGAQAVRVTSPMLHDNVTGLTFQYAEQPTTFLLPQEIGQPLVAGDLLTVQLTAAATSDAVAVLCNYYENLPGAVARLYNWADISGNIKSIKACEVDCTTSATIGQWSDTLITTTENQLHARTDYAVLGYESSVAVVTVALKGQETGNLRVGGPGPTSSFPTSDYFVSMSNMHGTPHIPVFNADNRGSIYVSTAANTASVATKITLILAEMVTPLS